MTLSLVIAAGGTGGHVIPALAIAATVSRLRPDARITFVGTPRGLEREMVPSAGYEIATTSVRPFARSVGGVMAAASLVPATRQARWILRRTQAAAVLGMGGYPSIPAVLAARTMRIPILLHEQNAIPGLGNEIGARLTRQVAVAFPQTVGRLRHARLVGLPIREKIASLDRVAARQEAVASFGLAADRLTVLAFGGSLGAARLNAAILAVAEQWQDRDDLQVLFATGRAHHDSVSAQVPDGKLIIRCVPYLDRMDLAYAVADVAVCRAGASTVHELAVTGLPAILVPFPHARRREQDENARLLADAGAAGVLADVALNGSSLASALEPILADEGRRSAMAVAARGASRADAARVMAEWLLALAEGRDG